jgi:hypothetical protein
MKAAVVKSNEKGSCNEAEPFRISVGFGIATGRVRRRVWSSLDTCSCSFAGSYTFADPDSHSGPFTDTVADTDTDAHAHAHLNR